MSNLVQNQGINLVLVNKAGQMFARFHDNKETYLIGVNSNGYDIVIQNPGLGLKEIGGNVVEDAIRCPSKNESNS
jgi:hypothetical protein